MRVRLSEWRVPVPLTLLLLLGAFAPWTAVAQDAEAAPDTASEASELLEPWRPERLAPGGEAGTSMTLLDAVTTTLRNDPNIQIQEAETALRLGLQQEASGLFDWTLTGQATYQHENLELRQSVQESEQERRDDLTRIQGETCSAAESELVKISELTAAIESNGGVAITTDEIFNAELRAIEILISNASPSELPSLINQRNLLLNRELAETIASQEANANACTEAMAFAARIGDTPEEEEFDTASLDLRLEKVFRNGVTFAPFIDGDYSATQYVGKRNGFNQPALDEDGNQIVDFGVPRIEFVDFGGKNIRDLYTLRVGFDINVPLMRGSGSEEIAAQEEAAGRQVEAARRLIQHTASERVLATAFAYWDLLAAQDRVALFAGSVDRQKTITEVTQALIDADEMIPAEIARAQAGLARAETNLNAARRDLVQRQVALAVAMGIESTSGEASINASTSFPAAPDASALGAVAEESLRRSAVDRRGDVASARESLEASRILVAGAEGAARDRLDLQGSLYATAVGEDSLSEATDQWEAPSYSIGLSYEKIIGNQQREGLVVQRKALAARDRIQHADLRRTTQLGVSQTVGELGQALERLRYAEEAVKAFDQAYSAEREKFGAQETTLIDLVLSEDQQTDAGLRAIDARRQVASLLAQLRFDTATLIDATDRGFAVEDTTLTTLPSAE
ncbi:MAG: TolC family protein [Acidobacteriota bacterium]